MAPSPSSVIMTTPQGHVLAVRVRPNASSTRIVGRHGDSLKVAVTAPPEHGKANAALIDLLARRLNVAPSLIEIISGHASPNKRVRVPLSVTLETLRNLAASSG